MILNRWGINKKSSINAPIQSYQQIWISFNEPSMQQEIAKNCTDVFFIFRLTFAISPPSSVANAINNLRS